MNALFAYGTLLFPEVVHAVTGRTFASSAATLDGFVRCRLIGEIFPAIVAAAEHERVAGVLYRGLESGDWRRLDAFEGDLYERREVIVRVGAGVGASSAMAAAAADGRAPAASHQALTYVLRDDWRHRLAAEPWDPQAFARDHLDRFAARLGRASGPSARSGD